MWVRVAPVPVPVPGVGVGDGAGAGVGAGARRGRRRGAGCPTLLCVISIVAPATTTVPVLGGPVFASTLNSTWPLPSPRPPTRWRSRTRRFGRSTGNLPARSRSPNVAPTGIRPAT